MFSLVTRVKEQIVTIFINYYRNVSKGLPRNLTMFLAQFLKNADIEHIANYFEDSVICYHVKSDDKNNVPIQSTENEF